MGITLCCVTSVACGDLGRLAGDAELPTGVSDASATHTPAGAMQLYNGALYNFIAQGGYSGNYSTGAFVDFVLASGLLTDELQAGNLGGSGLAYTGGAAGDSLDARQFPEWSLTYSMLQAVRGSTIQAIGALNSYYPTASPALRGHMHALQAYADLLLADLYCSGVPLSTVDFNRDYTYQAGSSTEATYTQAVALFDSSIAESTDSIRVLNLARVGKGRALLNLKRYTDAAQTVAAVPNDFQYAFFVNWGATTGGNETVLDDYAGTGVTVADAEGGIGLPYISSGDPRSASMSYRANSYGASQYFPVKYGVSSPAIAPMIVASGIEARLIEAEAALNTNAGDGQWVKILNALRTTCVSSSLCPTPAPAGIGGVAGLPPLEDPGNDTARVTLLFTERAYWLFMTGQRQQDLRRLIRQYNRPSTRVYPIGRYPIAGKLPNYGSDVTLDIPQAEALLNPKFSGCLSRGA